MRKTGREKARVSNHHLNSQTPNFFSITKTDCSMTSKLRLQITSLVSRGGEKRRQVQLYSHIHLLCAFHVRLSRACISHGILCRFTWRLGRAMAMLEQNHPAYRGHLLGQLPFLHQNFPWLLFAVFIL